MKLTEEQKELLNKCKTKEEIKELAKENNIEVTDADLDKVAGGIGLASSNGGASTRTIGRYCFSDKVSYGNTKAGEYYYFVNNDKDEACRGCLIKSYDKSNSCYYSSKKHKIYRYEQYSANSYPFNCHGVEVELSDSEYTIYKSMKEI